MTSAARRLLLGTMCSAVLVACGGSTGGTGGGSAGGGSGGSGGGSGLTGDQACTDLATALCNKTNSCSTFVVDVFYGDLTTCTARAKLGCTPALGLSSSGATPSKIEACSQAVNGLTCPQIRDGLNSPACEFMGTQAAGTGCGSSSQCAGAYCKFGSGSCGVCSSKLALGATCTSSDDCAGTAVCANGLCVTPRTASNACSASQPCASGLWCKSGVCALAGTAGQPCESTVSESCDFVTGFWCTDANVCARIQVSSAGASCGITSTTYTTCRAGATCSLGGGTSGLCVAAAADGQACNPNNDLNCRGPAECVNGVCKLVNPATCQ